MKDYYDTLSKKGKAIFILVGVVAVYLILETIS